MGEKQKVRLVVPAGSKGKIENGKFSSEKMVLPPGQIKFTGVGEDGMPEAEVVEQMSAQDYLKNLEKMSNKVSETDKKPSVQKMAKDRADVAKKMRKEIIATSSTPADMSGISKTVFSKSQSLMERGQEQGINFFTLEKIKSGDEEVDIAEYLESYIQELSSVIIELKKSNQKKLFDDDTASNVKKFIAEKSAKEIAKTVREMAVFIHKDIDRRARVSMSKKSLEIFIDEGKIGSLNLDSESLRVLRKKRDAMLGNKDGLDEFSFTPIELMHGIFIDKIGEMLYSQGTHFGSEEFADYGRGIELVLRAENSPRIGYGRKSAYENGGIFVQINEEDEEIIEAAIFGQVIVSGENRELLISDIIEASITKNYSKLVKKNDEDIFEAFIVGEISLNDVEHVKIPLSIFNVKRKRVASSNLIAGADMIRHMFNIRNYPKDKAKEFFEKDGIIGGGYTPKHLSYLLELEAAEELKEKLLSMGMSDVIFTNKDGVDIMGEDTWITPPPTKKKGKAALQEIAKNEVLAIIDKIAPPPEKPKPKVPKKQAAPKQGAKKK